MGEKRNVIIFGSRGNFKTIAILAYLYTPTLFSMLFMNVPLSTIPSSFENTLLDVINYVARFYAIFILQVQFVNSR